MTADLIDSSDSEHNVNFLSGIYCLWHAKYEKARRFFLAAAHETDPLDRHNSVYLSYSGLAAVLMDNTDGILQHCYHSSDTALKVEPEVQLNLACAEFIKGNRRLGVQAMDKINDSGLSTGDSEEVNTFYNLVGKRKKDAKGSPVRNSIVRKSVGKIFRKKARVDGGHIEAFIIDATKKRYRSAMSNFNQ